MSKPIDEVAGLTAPFVHTRRIRFGESDAAGIVYTGNFPLLALEAVEEWFALWGDAEWYDINARQGFGTPFVHLSLDLKAPLRPAEVLAMTVTLPEVGTSSMTFAVEGRRPDGVLSFTATLMCVTARPAEEKTIPIPAPLRARIDAYRAACGRA
ncbi:acyl-CoA thioesterase [Novispirillum sp. DQ9]|uniref:acyl-CoA thioesterase n=1 Tax=Novispirillum sp. DQ9 TaxID=3398612 RepID=UPI003C7E43BD